MVCHGGQGIFRAPVSTVLPYFRAATGGNPLISECELSAALLAVAFWSRGGARNVVLCTDNQNVLSWVEQAKSHSPVANRILRAINFFCLDTLVGILPVYVSSEHNLFADGLTRGPPGEIDQWALAEGMAPVDAVAQLWAGMALSYNPAMGAIPTSNTSALLGNVLHFYKSYNYKICEWRPSHYAVAGICENWGIPVYSDHVMDMNIRNLLARRVSHPLSVVGEDDIFL